MTRSYLKLVSKVINCPLTPNRTGVKARSKFGHQLKFDLSDDVLPIITTKPIPFRLIVTELLWFLRGQTNQKILENDGNRIWRENSTREYLDSRGLTTYTEYETLGPIYGFQWRHFGAEYKDCHTDYTGCGIDQLTNVINMIRCDPTNRRIIMTAWNPKDLDRMALPPCHIFIQFNVSHDGRLSGHLYQRSADLMLGVPFNITSYALLIHIIAKICGLKPGKFIHSFGDVHIYENHMEGAFEQLTRIPEKFPKLKMTFNANVDDDNDNSKENDADGATVGAASTLKPWTSKQVDGILCNMKFEDFKLINYKYNPKPIKFQMAV